MQIVIVEDEPVIAQRLVRQIGEILVDQNPRLKCFDNLDDAESYLSENVIDILFLDLNLNGADGFDLLKLVVAASFHTIIVSAYADQAIKAFEFGVLDFVAKPFNKARLAQALERISLINDRVDYGAKQLAIKKPSGLHLITINDIQFIKADGHYTQLHMFSEDQHLHDKSIDKLWVLLPANFERIHRSYIVNMNQVASINIEPGGSYRAVLKNGKLLPISRTRFNQVKKKIEQ